MCLRQKRRHQQRHREEPPTHLGVLKTNDRKRKIYVTALLQPEVGIRKFEVSETTPNYCPCTTTSGVEPHVRVVAKAPVMCCRTRKRLNNPVTASQRYHPQRKAIVGGGATARSGAEEGRRSIEYLKKTQPLYGGSRNEPSETNTSPYI